MSTPPTVRPRPDDARTTASIARLLGGTLEGDPEMAITALKPPEKVGRTEIAYLSPDRKIPVEFSPGCVLVDELYPAGVLSKIPAVIRHRQAPVAFADLIEIFMPSPPPPFSGISPHSRIDPTAVLRDDVSIAPGVFIGPGVSIGRGTIIHPGAILEQRIDIGEEVVIRGNVTIYPNTKIGDRTVLHASSVIGGDGFGYIPGEGNTRKVPQRGGVEIGADCEIGCGSTIDRGVLENTVIGDGCKLDNLVQVGHNCILGTHCLLAGQVGLAGSTILGSGTQMGGQSGVIGHLEVGAGARIATKTAVTSDVDAGAQVMGFPSIDVKIGRRAYALIAHLPEMRDRIRALEAQLKEAGISPETTEENASS